MSRLGIGTMLHILGGGSKHEPKEYFGLEIADAEFSETSLTITFENGKKIRLWDDGQSCCESRYMTTDDDVKSLIGHTLVRIDAKHGPDEAGEYEDAHETIFIEIGTDQNFITIVTHNEHNGYYGGFGLKIDEIPSDGYAS